jgi:hypothetical protein
MLLVQSGRGRRGGSGKGAGRKGGGAAAAQQARQGERPLDSELATAALSFLGKSTLPTPAWNFMLAQTKILAIFTFLIDLIFADN